MADWVLWSCGSTFCSGRISQGSPSWEVKKKVKRPVGQGQLLGEVTCSCDSLRSSAPPPGPSPLTTGLGVPGLCTIKTPAFHLPLLSCAKRGIFLTPNRPPHSLGSTLGGCLRNKLPGLTRSVRGWGARTRLRQPPRHHI